MIPSARLPLAFVASLSLGCAGLTPPLTPPERGGAAWIELSSKHFVLDTDVAAAEADSTLAEFESIHSAIEDVAFPSDVELRDGSAVLGLPLVSIGITTGSEWRSVEVALRDRLYVPLGALPPVSQLLRAGYAEFMAADNEERPSLDDQRKQTAYYLASWGFVHMLYSVPAYKALFNAVIEDVARGKKLDVAWAARFAAVDSETLESDFRKHMIRTEGIEVQAWTTKYTPRPGAEPPQRRALSAADVHLLWARLRAWTPQHLPAARTDVDAARALDAASPEIQYWSGLFRRAEGDREGAESDLSRALALRPNDARYLMALGTFYRDLPRSAPQDRLDEIVRRLAKVAVSPRALDFVASHHGAAGQIDDGLRFAARATKADAACSGCYATGARLLFAKERFDEAVDAAERAVNLLPDGVRAPQLTRDLQRYRQARDGAKAAKSP